MSEKIFLDSNVVFYCAGNIGYRWAVKVIKKIALEEVDIKTDVFLFQDILDRFFYINDRYTGEVIFKNIRKIVADVVPVTVADFDLSCDLRKKYPQSSPRILLKTACAVNNGSNKICSTYSTDMEIIKEVERVNLMDKLYERNNN